MKHPILLAALAVAAAVSATPGYAQSDPYQGGTAYPEAATVSLQSFDVPVGATEVHVAVTLDRPTANTVIAYPRVYSGAGGVARPDATKPVFFRPGDPLVKTVSFRVYPLKEGSTLHLIHANVPDGGKRGAGDAVITARAGAVNAPIAQAGRAPLSFAPYGELAYSVTGQSIKFDDDGGADTFSTALDHGRTQPDNKETGYYAPVDWGGFERTSEGLALVTEKLPEPYVDPARNYTTYHRAASLSGHKASDTWFTYGSVEIEAKLPNRKGSWPALWLLKAVGWPPEIDIFEGFYYNNDFKPGSQLSTNLHGGKSGTRTFTRPMMRLKMSDLGLKNTLDSDFHKFQVTVTPEWITLFVDGVETMQYANPFAGTTWYPIVNVGVKADPKAAYTDGSGTLVLKSLKVWKAE